MSENPDLTAANAVMVVFCTCPDAAVAQEISEALVTTGVAACVNRLEGVTSTYRWEGKLCHDVECLLLIKTTASAMQALESCISKLHPYELPEVLAVPCNGGSENYLAWVKSATSCATPTAL